MNRISNAFRNGKAFIGFVTGGDPTLEASEAFILAMAEAGADLIEIGVPFSDPIAEGPVIQAANIRALNAGTTINDIFLLVKRVRAKSEIPLVLLTYLNPVFRRGYCKFFRLASESGVDGIIIPDMPFEEQPEARQFARDNGVALISMVAPTSAERISDIAREADGFLYVVSSMGVTGVREEITTDVNKIIETIRDSSDIPAAVGFGMSRPEQARAMAKYADGVIVGSSIVRFVERHGVNAAKYIEKYTREMKDAVTAAT